MKWLGMLVAALVVCLLFAGCYEKEKDASEFGGTGVVRDWTNPDAPKSITSKEINLFEYEFNCDFFRYYGRMNQYDYCSFSLVRQQEGALCTGWGYGEGDAAFEFEFVAPLSSLDALQALVFEYDLAKANGTDVTVEGIPEHMGSRLSVEYASGESIYAYDNRSGVMGGTASLALFDLFLGLAGDAGDDFLSGI
ncbi:MAG: hypothetical protein ACOYI4_03260 [Christensenellales bacterium]|jgi:hypothetical protein